MDAIAALLAHPDLETLGYVLVVYLWPMLLYCVASILAFVALTRTPGSPAGRFAQGLAILAVPILGALWVLARSAARSPAPAKGA